MDGDGVENDFAGDFGTYSDTATFAFALTFTRALETTSLENSLAFNIISQPAAGTITTSFDPDADFSTDGTNFIYTFYYEVQDLYGASGTYFVDFTKDIQDDAGNTIDYTTLNPILTASDTGACSSGTCQFENNPVTLIAATFNPSTAVVLKDSDSADPDLQVTLTFSEPVSFNGTTSDIDGDFDLQHTDLNGGTITATTDLESTLQSTLPNTVSTTTDNVHYTEHVLTIQDTSRQYWARTDYYTQVGESSLLKLFFENITTQANGVTYIESFQTATAAFITLPTTIQDGTAANGTSTTQFSVITQIPELTSASPISASGSNVQGDGASSRHVQFTFNLFDPSFGDAIGMHLLFRTTDGDFDISDDTAPYYGAEGGIVLTGNDLEGDNSASTGYHICPPFSKHLDRLGTGIQHTLSPTYNANRLKIHYLAIPYDPVGGAHLSTTSEIAANPSTFSVDFTSNLPNTEPCVRSAFYNEGQGQYGYVVDSDMEEQYMVIANAMLQDANGSQQDLAMLPKDQLNSVYFDLYSKDYYNDSWRRDLTITAQDLIDQLTAANLNTDSLHNDASDITISIDQDYLSIFASRFVNTINARFLDSVFFDALQKSDIWAHSKDYVERHQELIDADSRYSEILTNAGKADWFLAIEDDYFNPNYRNQNPDAFAVTNDNRIVLSIGVHPAAISVDPGDGTAFTPFETDQANFLKMDPAFYGLYYGGVANTTEPAFDYTSRHLAYVNFDLVYELDIDPVTQQIQAAKLEHIVSPFTLLKNSFFSDSYLEEIRDNDQSYTAVATSIADNVFRHNFYGTADDDLVQHFLTVGLYCYDPLDAGGICKNDHAQMLLPNPNDAASGYKRDVVSPHYLHRTVLHFNASGSSSPLESYTIGLSGDDGFANGNPGLLLELFMRLNDDVITTIGSSNPFPSAPDGIENTYIGDRAYSSMLYNSFDRDHGFDYSYSTTSDSFAQTFNLDGEYATAGSYEQQYWALSPYAESPDARADQILPNAFFLGGQVATPYHYQFTVQPYQYSGFTQQINPHLADSDYLINKNTLLRGLAHDMGNSDWTASGANSFNIYHSFAFPNSSEITNDSQLRVNQSATNAYDNFVGRDVYRWPNTVAIAHIADLASHSATFSLTQYGGLGNNFSDDDRDHGVSAQKHQSLYHSGRTIGYYGTKETYRPVYALNEAVTDGFPGPSTSSTMAGFRFQNNRGARHSINDNYVELRQSSSYDGQDYAATISSSILYDDGGQRRMFLPHHLDDYDFDRGQIMANKLGFFLDNGEIMEYHQNSSSNFYGFVYSRLLFPSDPTITTPETTTTDYIGTTYDSFGLGEVDNYYPLVRANESLHTAADSWPVLLTRHDYAAYNGFYDHTDSTVYERASRFSGIARSASNSTNFTKLHQGRSSSAVFPIALDKIFPEGYRYQLGFVNREELFMYDATVGNGDTAATPVISRLYESAVGHFGYATQFSRLNRRSMQKYHLGTSSQFLGDHLARFETEPTAGVHTPSDLDSVFDHTPANQGATGTNYGSYGEGHYDLTTSTDSQLSGTWRHRTYEGTLRGYVLELRTNPLEENYYDEYDSTTSTYPNEDNGGLQRVRDITGNAHPDGNP